MALVYLITIGSHNSVASERASEPRDRSEPSKRRARARVRESEGRSPSAKTRSLYASQSFSCRAHPRGDDESDCVGTGTGACGAGRPAGAVEVTRDSPGSFGDVPAARAESHRGHAQRQLGE